MIKNGTSSGISKLLFTSTKSVTAAEQTSTEKELYYLFACMDE